jgi:hypothetical protein
MRLGRRGTGEGTGLWEPGEDWPLGGEIFRCWWAAATSTRWWAAPPPCHPRRWPTSSNPPPCWSRRHPLAAEQRGDTDQRQPKPRGGGDSTAKTAQNRERDPRIDGGVPASERHSDWLQVRSLFCNRMRQLLLHLCPKDHREASKSACQPYAAPARSIAQVLARDTTAAPSVEDRDRTGNYGADTANDAGTSSVAGGSRMVGWLICRSALQYESSHVRFAASVWVEIPILRFRHTWTKLE